MIASPQASGAGTQVRTYVCTIRRCHPRKACTIVPRFGSWLRALSILASSPRLSPHPLLPMSGTGAAAGGDVGRSTAKYNGFSWHSCKRQTVVEASAVIEKHRDAKGGKSAIDWGGFRVLADGFYLQWKKPCTFKGGYH